MKRFFLLLFIGFMVFNCKSKKEIVTKSNKPNTQQAPVRRNNLDKEVVTTPKTYKNPSVPTKPYANNTERYIDMYKDFAQVEMKLYEVPASITLAQGILESASGNGRLAVEANNHFGIKCGNWTGSTIYHDDDKAQECFRKYSEPKYSFRDHSLFIAQRDRYANLFQLKIEDYKGWAKGLQAAGYATDKNYHLKLIRLIELYELYKYDQAVLDEIHNQSISSVQDEKEINQLKSIQKETPVQTAIKVAPAQSAGTTFYTVSKEDTLYSISMKHNMTVKALQDMNGLKDNYIRIGQKLVVNALSEANENAKGVYIVEKGDTLYSISMKHNMSVKALQNINGLKDTYIGLGQKLIVNGLNKANRSSRVVYKVEKGDTLYSISKKHNITVKNLQSMNGLKDNTISIGQVLTVKEASKN